MSLTICVNQLSFSAQKEENTKEILQLMSESDAQLDVFPEYSMGIPANGINKGYVRENAEPLDGEFVQRIVDGTLGRHSAVVFTTFLKEKDSIYNTAILAKSGKIQAVYKKIHLFDAFGNQESAIFTAGNKLATADLEPFKIGLAVCFDLRFPEIFRAMMYKGVNLFIIPSGWYEGEYKIEQWRALLAARAHENVSYLVAANQTSPSFIGHSTVIHPMGYPIKEVNHEKASFLAELDFEELQKARQSIPIMHLAKRDLYPVL